MKHATVLVVWVVSAFCSIDARAAEQEITASDAVGSELFGYSVAISGDAAIVGAMHDNDNGSASGSAYFFRREGTAWVGEQKITPDDGEAGDKFGNSVAISGDYAIVGAYQDDDKGWDSGSAYIFHRVGGTWVQEDKLTDSGGNALDQFGVSVGISGDYAVVGADQGDGVIENSGTVCIFHREGTNWVQQQTLTYGNPEEYDHFGISVAIDGDYAVIGSSSDDDFGPGSGAAYIFERTGLGWVQDWKLTASDADDRDYFGASVAISGSYVIVGADGDEDNGASSGSAYVFKRSIGFPTPWWAQQAKLVACAGDMNDSLGGSVAISGSRAVVGAPYNDGKGSAHVFARDGAVWSSDGPMFASDGVAEDVFGESVAISGDLVMVGARGDDDAGDESGSVYAYDWADFPQGIFCDGFRSGDTSAWSSAVP